MAAEQPFEKWVRFVNGDLARRNVELAESLNARLRQGSIAGLLEEAGDQGGRLSNLAFQVKVPTQIDAERLAQLTAQVSTSLDWPRIAQLQFNVAQVVNGSGLRKAVESANAALTDQLDWDAVRVTLVDLQHEIDAARASEATGEPADAFRWIDLLPPAGKVKLFLVVMAVLNNVMVIAARADGAVLPHTVGEIADTLLLVAGYLADRLPSEVSDQ
ncbi:MAG: hypothetical protein JST59_26445 [Actinobacteria bacterium]|nr:hypothetical protein [Actinomycetota bacterium]